MAKWFKENATLLSAGAFLVASWIFGFGGIVEVVAHKSFDAVNGVF